MTDLLIIAVLLLGLVVLGSSRVASCIRLVAAQGVMVAALLMAGRIGHLTTTLIAVVAATVVLKGWAMPWLLFRSIRAARVEREVDPYLGYTSSLVLGTLAIGVAFALAGSLPQPQDVGSKLVIPASLAALFTGLLLLVTRKKAVTQVLGYLVLENGILMFSLAMGAEMPILVEMGILLDIFVAVFVMGITIYHISRQFDNIDANNLRELNDMSNGDRRWLIRRLRNGAAAKENTER